MPYAAILLGGLMISRIRYVHLLNLFFRERKPFIYLAGLVFAAFAVLILPAFREYVLLAGFGGYVLSGPAVYGWGVVRRRRAASDDPSAETNHDSA